MSAESSSQESSADVNNRIETNSLFDEDLGILDSLSLPENLTLPCFRYDDDYSMKGKGKKENDPTNVEQNSLPSFYLDQKSEICQKCNQLICTLPLEDVVMNSKTETIELPIVMSSGDVSKHWDAREQTIMVGIIFDTLYRRGSLVPSRSENDFTWNKIKKTFDQACTRYQFLTRQSLGEKYCDTRTKLALFRQFKTLKFAVATQDTDEDEVDEKLLLFKKMHHDWENKYNQNRILTCSEKRFSKFLAQFKKLSVHHCQK